MKRCFATTPSGDRGIASCARDSSPAPFDSARRSTTESVYARGIGQREDRIIDELIALEALAGSGTELRFRIAFRISSLLASDDAERLALFETIKRHYDIRSKIVHGNELKSSERALVDEDAELRAIVRRLVRAVIWATIHTDLRLTAAYIDEQLDHSLLDTKRRQEPRAALNLS